MAVTRKNDAIPQILYILVEILEEVLDQLDQDDYQMPDKLKALFLLYDQNDSRFNILSSSQVVEQVRSQ